MNPMTARSVNRLARSVLAASLLLGLAPAAAASVLVVSAGGGPGVDFTSVQAAVDAAADGDVLLVVGVSTSHIDEVLAMPDKGLVIMGLSSPFFGKPQVGRLNLPGLSAGRSVIVRGLSVGPVQVDGCAGAVLLEDCAIGGGQVPFAAPFTAVKNSAHVAFTRCTFLGAASGFGTFPGEAGLAVDASTVALYDCQLTGGAGRDATFLFDEVVGAVATEGGQGLQIWSGTVFASGSEIRGGEGGSGAVSQSGLSCQSPKKGGTGVRTHGQLIRLDTTIAGGLPGFAPPCASPANQGADVITQGDGSVSVLPEAARELEITSPVESDGDCHVSIVGQPGDNVVLLQSLVAFGQLHAGLKGMLAGQPPYFTFLLGTIGPTGSINFNAHMPPGPLPAGIEAVTLIVQVLTGADSGGGLLSSPSVITLVDDLP